MYQNNIYKPSKDDEEESDEESYCYEPPSVVGDDDYSLVSEVTMFTTAQSMVGSPEKRSPSKRSSPDKARLRAPQPVLLEEEQEDAELGQQQKTQQQQTSQQQDLPIKTTNETSGEQCMEPQHIRALIFIAVISVAVGAVVAALLATGVIPTS